MVSWTDNQTPQPDPLEPVHESAPADEELEVDSDQEGPERRVFRIRRERKRRLDVYLHQRLKGFSRNKIQQLIEAGGVTVNARIPKASTLLHRGDVVEVILPPPALKEIVPEPIPLQVIYEDSAFIVLNKQAGIIVHPARGQHRGTLVNGLAWYFKQQLETSGRQWSRWTTRGFGAHEDAHRPVVRAAESVSGLSSVGAEELRPGIIHRLDKNTTGVLVVAKSDQAHWQIARQFQDRTALKAYLALVHGNPNESGGVIEEPIGKHPMIREAYCVRHDRLGKPAVTLFRVREQYAGFALVELELKTGRTHQIRVHLSYMGHPVVGDILYGGEPIGESDLDRPPVPAGARRLANFARTREQGLKIEEQARKRPDLILAHPALHAAFLRFVHPVTQQPGTFTAPVHEPMVRLIRQLRSRRINAPVAREGWWVDLKTVLPD